MPTQDFIYKITYVVKYRGRYVKNVKYFDTRDEAKYFLKKHSTATLTSPTRKERIVGFWGEPYMVDADYIRGVYVNNSGIADGRVLIYDESGGELIYAVITCDLENLEALDPDFAVITDVSGVLTTSMTNATEVTYLSGTTSNIQDQIDTKSISGHSHDSLYTRHDGAIGNSLAVITDSSGQLKTSSTTSTQIGYLSSLTSSAQGQLDARVGQTGFWSGDKAVYSDSLERIHELAITKTELESLDGVTSLIQDQLDDKVDIDVTWSGGYALASSGVSHAVESTCGIENLELIGSHIFDTSIPTISGATDTFAGHFCLYTTFEAATDIEAGWLMQMYTGDTPGGVKVSKRYDNGRLPIGVSLESVSSGEDVKVALWGFVDVQILDADSRGAIGDPIQAGAGAGEYHLGDVIAYGSTQIGFTAAMTNENYEAGWARMFLSINLA